MYEEQEKMDDTTPRWFKLDKDTDKGDQLSLADETMVSTSSSPSIGAKERKLAIEKKKQTQRKKQVSFSPKNDSYPVPGLRINLEKQEDINEYSVTREKQEESEKKGKVARRHSNTEDISDNGETSTNCYKCAVVIEDSDDVKLEERSHTARNQRLCYYCRQVVSQESIAEDLETYTPDMFPQVSPPYPLSLKLTKTESCITEGLCDLLEKTKM